MLDVHSSNSVHIEEPPPLYDDFAKYKIIHQHDPPPTYEEVVLYDLNMTFNHLWILTFNLYRYLPGRFYSVGILPSHNQWIE